MPANPARYTNLPRAILRRLRSIRVAAGLKREHIVSLTKAAGRPITLQRLTELETGPVFMEPYFQEAVDLARILLLDGILPMISDCPGEYPPHHLRDDFNLEIPIPNERQRFLDGVPMPLTMACRIAVSLGLEDPIHLDRTMLSAQMWDVIERNERGAEPGCCPWCLADILAGEPHTDLCLPAHLWAPRVLQGIHMSADMPKPTKRARGAGRGLAGRKAVNLRKLRKARKLTQVQLGSMAAIHANYVARLEQGGVNLSTKVGLRLAAALGCRVEDLMDGTGPVNEDGKPINARGEVIEPKATTSASGGSLPLDTTVPPPPIPDDAPPAAPEDWAAIMAATSEQSDALIEQIITSDPSPVLDVAEGVDPAQSAAWLADVLGEMPDA